MLDNENRITDCLLKKSISHLLSLLTFLTNTLFISLLYKFIEWRQWQENNLTADQSQAHLPWMNTRLCLNPKVYSATAASLSGLFRKLIFKNNYFYSIIIILNVIRTEPWHHGCTPSTPLVFTLNTQTGKNQCGCKMVIPVNYLLVQPVGGINLVRI